MCGICGLVGPEGATIDLEAARAMREVLRHRGPDGAGELEIAASGLRGWVGHRRLKIIDLTEAADQPMTSEDGSVVLTYNGEVYNFRELRRELEGRGFRFRSTGDTEVVLRAYEAWGEGFLERIDGMFALAVWDSRRGRLLLARDRTGKKPLFYAARDGRISFGSEIKSVLASPWVDARPALERLPEYLTFGYIPSPHTFYEGIRQVPPASYVVFDREGTSEPREYWDPLPEDGVRPIEPADYERFAVLLRKATRERMVSDVPLGVLLSGGLDSSIVVALMSEAVSEPVHTFSIGFPDESSFDERGAARVVAERFETHHTEFAVQMDALALMDRLLWHHDQPYADSSAIPTYIVSRLAREHVTVALNGDGGDEVFAGYDRFRAAMAPRLPGPVAAAARGAVRLIPRTHGYFSPRRRAERALELADAPVTERYQSWIAVANRDLLGELLAGPAPPRGDVEASMWRSYERASELPVLDRILYANFKNYLPDDLAVKMDRMSMANSLEARSPFLDTAVVEHAARIRARDKVGARRLKPVLRRAFWPLLPPEIWNQRKHGFGVPMGTWFRGELRGLFEDEVLAPGARSAGLLDGAAVRRLFDEHVAGVREHGFRLWTLLTLEHWLRSLERPLAQGPPAAGVADAEAATLASP